MAHLLVIIAACASSLVACDRRAARDLRADASPSIEALTEALHQELVKGMPWERVKAKAIHARRIQAISVRASVRLRCPAVQRVPYAPLPKNTGMREFAKLDLIEVDQLQAHHVEAAEIVADEIVAMQVQAPADSGH